MFGFGREKPIAPSAEVGQGEGRSNEQEWAELMVQKTAREESIAQQVAESKFSGDITNASIGRGYEGNTRYGAANLEEKVPQIDLAAEKIVQLDAMRARIQESHNKPIEETSKEDQKRAA